MTTNNLPVSRKFNLAMHELSGEILIYDTRIDKAFCLNETSAAVWQLCDGHNSIGDISRLLSKKLKSPVTEDFVRLAINQFKKDDLLENGHEVQMSFEGLSRREIIRKVGFSSMVVLPVISSLIAPTTMMAQSAGTCIQQGGVCATSESCCSDAPFCSSQNCCITAGAFFDPGDIYYIPASDSCSVRASDFCCNHRGGAIANDVPGSNKCRCSP